MIEVLRFDIMKISFTIRQKRLLLISRFKNKQQSMMLIGDAVENITIKIKNILFLSLFTVSQFFKEIEND
jgi:hypothetical protein